MSSNEGQQSQVEPAQQPTLPFNSSNLFPIVGLLVLVAILALLLRSGGRTKIHKDKPSAKFCSARKIRRINQKARQQMATRDVTKTSFALNPDTGLYFYSCNPGGVIKGLAGKGKSVQVKALIRSAIGQAHSIVVTDADGELCRETAAYAKANGYEIHVYAPGVKDTSTSGNNAPFTGSFNPVDVMRDPDDRAKAMEITRALFVNNGEDVQKRHAYFGPQSDAITDTALMIAKQSQYPDLLMVATILSLPDLAERLDIAEKQGRFGSSAPDGLPYFAKSASSGLRSVAKSGKGGGESPGASIQSTALNNVSKFIDPEISKALLPSTIPLELKGKTIIYCRVDRPQIKATAPAVSVMMHLLLNHNLDKKRENNLTFITDEANFFILPDLEAISKLERKKGFCIWLSFQQNSGMDESYGERRWSGIESNLSNKIYFNTGELKSNEDISKRLGEKTIKIQHHSRSFGSSRSNSISDDLDVVPLVPVSVIDGMNSPGQCIVQASGYGHPIPYIDRTIPYDPKGPIVQLEKDCLADWYDLLLPAFQAEHKGKLMQRSIQDELEDRAVAANLLLPHPRIVALREQKRQEQQKKEQQQLQDQQAPVSTDKFIQTPQTLLPVTKG